MKAGEFAAFVILIAVVLASAGYGLAIVLSEPPAAWRYDESGAK